MRLLALGRRRRGALALAVLCGSLTIVAGVGLLATSAYLVSQAALRPPILSLMVAIVCVRAFAIARPLLRYAERLVSHDAGLRLLADLRTWFYERLEPLAPAGLGAHRSGDLLARAVGDVEGLQDLFVRSLAPWLVALVTVAVLVAAAWLFLPAAAVALAAGMALAGLVAPLLVRRLSRRCGPRLTCARARLTTELVELFEGAPEIVAFGCQAERVARVQEMSWRLRRLEMADAALSGLGGGQGVLLSGLTAGAVLLLAVPAVRAASLDGVLLAALALLPLAAFEAVAPLPGAYQGLDRQLEAGRRVLAIAGLPPPVEEPARPGPLPAPGRLTLEAGRLRYSPDLPWALDGVDLWLEPGRRVAVVGPSGAGKSTLASVLVRFLDLDSGRARLGGRDLRDYRSEDVRRIVGLVPQDVHLFNTSILENIRLARPGASLEEVESAAGRARLLPWLRSLAQGWDTRVGERGARVSGGQRQRIGLARALLAGFPILILDEPTAQLDHDSARGLVQEFLAATATTALLLITHRLYEMERMDEIVVLDRGCVVERGAHRQLLDLDGAYSRMWRLQALSRSPRPAGAQARR
jgi:thiol reductant ABC exporter CydC subunit